MQGRGGSRDTFKTASECKETVQATTRGKKCKKRFTSVVVSMKNAKDAIKGRGGSRDTLKRDSPRQSQRGAVQGYADVPSRRACRCARTRPWRAVKGHTRNPKSHALRGGEERQAH